jgi:hypothetical protein
MQAGERKNEQGLRPLTPAPLAQQPLVSVLMSNHNYGRYLKDSIESVLRQSYAHFELIICDDGSTDHSIEVIGSYLKDSRIRLLQKRNGGQATGFNACFRESRGDIICFLDADDLYLPTKLARVVECFRANADCGCVINKSLRADETLRPQGTVPLFASLPSGWLGADALRGGGILPNMQHTPGLNLRWEIAEKLFPLPETPPLNNFPDMVMMRLTPLLCRLAAVEDALAVIRLHSSNTYQISRISSVFIEKELGISGELWKEQRRLLTQIDTRLPEMLAPLDSAPIILQQKYICSRLNRTLDRRLHHSRLLRSMRAHDYQHLHRVFWRCAAFVPSALFPGVINLAMTQNRFKQRLQQLKALMSKPRSITRNECAAGSQKL